MRPLSAAEAISPAIERTRTVLFRPFKPGRSFKLAFIAYLSVAGSIFIPTPLFMFGSGTHSTMSVPGLTIAAGFGAVFSVIMFVFFYLGARLEFSLFDIVLLNERFVAPSWRRHAPQIWRWVGLKLLLSLIFTVISGPLFFIAFRKLATEAASMPPPGAPPPPHFFGHLMQLYALIGLPLGLAILCSSLITNFVLPSIALENTTIGQGLRRFLSFIEAEPGAFSLYVLLKAVLAIAGIIAMEAAIFITELLGAIPLAIVAVAGYFALRSAGPVGHLMMVAGGILLFVLFFVFLTFVGTLALGCVHVFLQAYALYFLGGRYPALGDLLEPPDTSLPSAAPPPPQVAPSDISPLPPPEPAV